MKDYRGFRIKELWAYTAIDENNDQEGIIGERINKSWIPFIGSDRVRVDGFRNRAIAIGQGANKTITLKKFNNMEVLEVLHKGTKT